MPSPLLVPPPWTLVAPSGVLHHVRDEDALRLLAVGDPGFLNDLRKLVGLFVERSTCKKLPLHKRQWQLLERVRWLQRVDSGEHIPIVGDARHYVQSFAHSRDDTAHFDELRLNQFLNGGWIWSNSKKVFEYAQKGSPYRWRLVDAPPNAAHLLPSVPAPSRFSLAAGMTNLLAPEATPMPVQQSGTEAGTSGERRIDEWRQNEPGMFSASNYFWLYYSANPGLKEVPVGQLAQPGECHATLDETADVDADSIPGSNSTYEFVGTSVDHPELLYIRTYPCACRKCVEPAAVSTEYSNCPNLGMVGCFVLCPTYNSWGN
mmetsp:Transcript_7846/g.11969  ORF Transcript_7846/g.11969 Transcript_7846/m.11969 type:complete len:318 (-) Transcript_7846:529-1482(-)